MRVAGTVGHARGYGRTPVAHCPLSEYHSFDNKRVPTTLNNTTDPETNDDVCDSVAADAVVTGPEIQQRTSSAVGNNSCFLLASNFWEFTLDNLSTLKWL